MLLRNPSSLRFFATNTSGLRRTALYDFHVANGGKMVDFAGWSLPVQYNDFGIIDSCLHTRTKSSLFDVSHMGHLRVFGRDRVKFVESMTVGDIAGLGEGESRLSVFTTDAGGILDDTVITSKPDHVQLILNAGCVDKDLAHIENLKANFDGDIHLEFHPEFSLLALQGPESVDVLQKLTGNVELNRVPFMSVVDCTVAGVPGCSISRSGYTGEDGFEISVPSHDGARQLAELLVADDSVRLAGLGVRDTLRIEAGLCLYGTDIDETTSPVEAGLSWTIGKRRRLDGGFPGFEIILAQLRNGVDRKRVGISILNGPPARHDNPIYLATDLNNSIGITTSGTFSPTLGKAVAIAYIQTQHTLIDTEVLVEVRKRTNPAVITKFPFVKSNYFRIK